MRSESDSAESDSLKFAPMDVVIAGIIDSYVTEENKIFQK